MKDSSDSSWKSRLARAVVFLIMRLVTRVSITGLENLPRSGSFVIASNHLGRLDPLLVYYLLDRQDVIMLVAEKYQKYALVRWFVAQLRGVFIDRFNPDVNALRTALNRMKQGEVLVLAPEGTRSKTEALIRAHPGVIFLAAKAGVPIVPVAIVGTEDRVVKARLRRLKRADISVRVGRPFTLPALKPGDREAQLQEYTDELMCQIAVLLPRRYRGVYAEHPRLLALPSSPD